MASGGETVYIFWQDVTTFTQNIVIAKSRPGCIITTLLCGQFLVCAALSGVAKVNQGTRFFLHYPSGCTDNWGRHAVQLGNAAASPF